MKTPKHSLRKIVTFLNNSDEDGGFWLPNIQRPFVWSEEQMCRLFDSILRQYPISTLLIWKTKSELRRRKFIDNFREEHRHRLTDFYVPVDAKKKCLVLDGQLGFPLLLDGAEFLLKAGERLLHFFLREQRRRPGLHVLDGAGGDIGIHFQALLFPVMAEHHADGIADAGFGVDEQVGIGGGRGGNEAENDSGSEDNSFHAVHS